MADNIHSFIYFTDILTLFCPVLNLGTRAKMADKFLHGIINIMLLGGDRQPTNKGINRAGDVTEHLGGQGGPLGGMTFELRPEG